MAEQFWEDGNLKIDKAAFESKLKAVEESWEPPTVENEAIPTAAPRNGLDWPPGNAGRIAELIYHSSPRPVREVAIVSAIGLLAGVCGSAWCIPKSGLNVYLILLARSGTGKEAMADGISMFIKGATTSRQDAHLFFDFNDFASGQALVKAVIQKSCFTHVSGEFGRKLKRMSNQKDTALQELRTVMTRLYSKSGPQAIAGGIAYSDKDKSVSTSFSVAFSMIGESTPGTFRQALTEDMMEDGFLSRFTVVEYDGERPPENPHHFDTLPDAWISWFSDLVLHAQSLLGRGEHVRVQREEDAAEMFHTFNLECDRNINASTEEPRRQMWNRAHLKSLRIAALLAVADNHHFPCITTQHAEWAIDLIKRDIAVFTSRLESGDIGEDDNARESKLLAIMKDYLTQLPTPGYKVPPKLRESAIIQRSYLQKRTSSLPSFKAHKLGATGGLDQALQSLCRSGYAMKCDKAKMVEAFSEHGDCYRILKLPQVK